MRFDPPTQAEIVTTTTPAIDFEQQQVEAQQPTFTFTSFSFGAASPSVAAPYPTTIDHALSHRVEQHSFPDDLSTDTSFVQI